MGILDRFRKTERVHFERNDAGKVTNVSREYEGRRGSRTPVSDALLRQDPTHPKNVRARERQAYRDAKVKAREEYVKSYTSARINRARQAGTRAGSITWADRLDNFANYSTRNNYNPFGNMFDTGMNYPKPRKKSSGGSKKFHVSGGVAYPIAGKKGKGKKKSSGRKRKDDWDVFGAFGGYGKW